MPDLAHRYAAWKAPQEDGAVLLWPDASQLISDGRANNASLSSAATLVQNTPLSDLRRQLRNFLGVHDDRQLVFATGHQTELHHPGVWAKNILIDAAAKATDGLAMHVAIDTDAPKHLALHFPGYSQPFTDDTGMTSVEWAQLVAPPTPAHLAKLFEDVASAAKDWPFSPGIQPLLDCCRRLSLDGENLPRLLTAALHEYDWSLGLRYSALLASPIWGSPPFLAFAYHLLAHADRFAHDYNIGLKSYRDRNGIRTPGRPMPELVVQRNTGGAASPPWFAVKRDACRDGDRCETPFWRDDVASGKRVRAWVERADERWVLASGDDRLDLDPAAPAEVAAYELAAFLRRNHLRLAPRALTLTMTLRLLFADQFVHGIGGGQYDQVADEIIARHFGIDPPRFCVTTATLYWPTAAGRERTSLPKIIRAGHRLKHDLLGSGKQQLLSAISAAPRRSGERQRLFQEIHAQLSSAAMGSMEIAAWAKQLRDASTKVIEERSIFDREIFYAMQPRERLLRMVEWYPKAMGNVR